MRMPRTWPGWSRPIRWQRDTRNRAPVFEDQDDDTPGMQNQSAMREVAETAGTGDNVGNAVIAEDPDPNADPLTYALSGADAALFSVTDAVLGGVQGGQITVKSGTKFDYETRTTYMVTVTATDSFGESASIDVTIMVTDVDEAPEISEGGLAITGVARMDYAENETGMVATYTASGPDASMATWSLEGDDAGDFDISSSGELTFVSAPDYENAADADMDNEYMVTVMADDGTNMDTYDVTVTVTNVDEMGTVTLSAMQPRVGTPIMATLTDLDDGITGTTWQWARSSDMSTWADIEEDATSDVYTPVAADAGSYLQATAMYTDGEGSGKMESEMSEQKVNNAPVFAEATPERSVEENTVADMYIGAPIEATDADNDDTLAYTLGGVDMASFAIDSATGQLMTMAALDFETETSYSVTVTASDGKDSATVMVTVMVTNVDEMGMVTLPAMQPRVGSGDNGYANRS